MPIYHCSIKPVQRSAGKSAVAAAAYRSRSTLHDARQSMTFSYIAKQDLVHAEIVGFDGDRGTLWNMAEAMEKRKDATVAREYEVALPIELDTPDQIELLRKFSQWLNDEYECVVDFAFHSGDGKNPHGHLLSTNRSIDANGTMSDVKIAREWSNKKRRAHGLPDRKVEVEKVRKKWAEMANQALEKAGIEARIDHRSYADQGIDRLPTTHMGPAAYAMERDGVQTRAGDHNRRMMAINLERQHELDELRDRRAYASRLLHQLDAIDIKIDRIRQDAVAQPATAGTIDLAGHRPDIQARADREGAKFGTGMAASIGERFKSKLFKDLWQVDLDPALLKKLKWVDVSNKALTLKTGEQIVDKGDTVSLSTGSDDAISAAIAMAKAKGWESVGINGSAEFQLHAALALESSGLKPKLTNELAQSRYDAELARRQALPDPAAKSAPKPAPVPDQQPELARAPIPKRTAAPYLRTLEDRVLVATMHDPIRPASHRKRDAKSLTDYAQRVWRAIDGDNAPEEMGKVFQTILKEQALAAGYSPEDLRAVQLAGQVSDPPELDPIKDLMQQLIPARRPHRKRCPNAGDRSPGT